MLGRLEQEYAKYISQTLRSRHAKAKRCKSGSGQETAMSLVYSADGDRKSG
jgi:hypothetical protein